MLEHTTTPFAVDKTMTHLIIDGRGNPVCAVAGEGPPLRERAEFIIVACNNYEKLLLWHERLIAEAADAADVLASIAPNLSHPSDENLAQYVRLMRANIAEAKGQS